MRRVLFCAALRRSAPRCDPCACKRSLGVFFVLCFFSFLLSLPPSLLLQFPPFFLVFGWAAFCSALSLAMSSDSLRAHSSSSTFTTYGSFASSVASPSAAAPSPAPSPPPPPPPRRTVCGGHGKGGDDSRRGAAPRMSPTTSASASASASSSASSHRHDQQQQKQMPQHQPPHRRRQWFMPRALRAPAAASSRRLAALLPRGVGGSAARPAPPEPRPPDIRVEIGAHAAVPVLVARPLPTPSPAPTPASPPSSASTPSSTASSSSSASASAAAHADLAAPQKEQRKIARSDSAYSRRLSRARSRSSFSARVSSSTSRPSISLRRRTHRSPTPPSTVPPSTKASHPSPSPKAPSTSSAPAPLSRSRRFRMRLSVRRTRPRDVRSHIPLSDEEDLQARPSEPQAQPDTSSYSQASDNPFATSPHLYQSDSDIDPHAVDLDVDRLDDEKPRRCTTTSVPSSPPSSSSLALYSALERTMPAHVLQGDATFHPNAWNDYRQRIDQLAHDDRFMHYLTAPVSRRSGAGASVGMGGSASSTMSSLKPSKSGKNLHPHPPQLAVNKLYPLAFIRLLEAHAKQAAESDVMAQPPDDGRFQFHSGDVDVDLDDELDESNIDPTRPPSRSLFPSTRARKLDGSGRRRHLTLGLTDRGPNRSTSQSRASSELIRLIGGDHSKSRQRQTMFESTSHNQSNFLSVR